MAKEITQEEFSAALDVVFREQAAKYKMTLKEYLSRLADAALVSQQEQEHDRLGFTPPSNTFTIPICVEDMKWNGGKPFSPKLSARLNRH